MRNEKNMNDESGIGFGRGDILPGACAAAAGILLLVVGFLLGLEARGAEVTKDTLFGDVDGTKVTVGEVVAASGIGGAVESEFNAWTNDVRVVAGFNAACGNYGTALGYITSCPMMGVCVGYAAKGTGMRSVSVGYKAEAAQSGTALGVMAYAPNDSVGFYQEPKNFYFNSKQSEAGKNKKSLQEYLDERAKKYKFVSNSGSSLSATNGVMYSLSAGTSGVTVTLPNTTTNYVQDFIIRLAPLTSEGTALVIKIPSGMSIDYPLGTNAVSDTITSPKYFTFMQVSPSVWAISAYSASQDEE